MLWKVLLDQALMKKEERAVPGQEKKTLVNVETRSGQRFLFASAAEQIVGPHLKEVTRGVCAVRRVGSDHVAIRFVQQSKHRFPVTRRKV